MRAIVSLSGGLDSTVLLAQVLRDIRPNDLMAVAFYYGSKHNQYENQAASQIAGYYEVSFRLIDLSGVMAGFRSDLLLSGGDIPEGHYEAESMRQTVVPCRNLIFASVLAGLAESVGAATMYLGVHAGDHFIYPDCRPRFIDAAREAIAAATDGKVSLRVPFLQLTKDDIVREGLLLNVPFALTRTCYKAQPLACGKCGSCQERLTAFAANNTEDPLSYLSCELLSK